MSTSPEFLIAFVGLFNTPSPDGTIGSAMVVNEKGYPLEFRVTTPVRPSAVQRALYGDSLDQYVSSELIVKQLTRDLARRPVVIFLNRLSAVDAEADVPMGPDPVSRTGCFWRSCRW